MGITIGLCAFDVAHGQSTDFISYNKYGTRLNLWLCCEQRLVQVQISHSLTHYIYSSSASACQILTEFGTILKKTIHSDYNSKLYVCIHRVYIAQPVLWLSPFKMCFFLVPNCVHLFSVCPLPSSTYRNLPLYESNNSKLNNKTFNVCFFVCLFTKLKRAYNFFFIWGPSHCH